MHISIALQFQPAPLIATIVIPGGGVSLTATTLPATFAALPLLVTITVNVAPCCPCANVPTCDLLTTMSASGVDELTLVTVLSTGVGSIVPGGVASVAVLLSDPLTARGTVPDSVNVTRAPTGRSTSWSMLPAPFAVPHAAPAPVGTQVQVNDEIGAGRMSWSLAPVTLLGPALVATMV